MQKSKPRAGAPLIVYGRPEDEFFHKRAAWSATFPVADRPVAKDELRQLRLVMLVDADQVSQPSATHGNLWQAQLLLSGRRVYTQSASCGWRAWLTPVFRHVGH